jgi:hypothetical protein
MKNTLFKKRFIAGIFICMLFFLSTLPAIASAKPDKNDEDFIIKPGDGLSIGLMMVWGQIIYHGDEYVEGYLCYNVTPIDLWYLLIVPLRAEFEFYRITENPCYIFKGIFLFESVTKNHMFLCYFGIM